MPKIPNAKPRQIQSPLPPEPIPEVGFLYVFPDSSNVNLVRYAPQDSKLWVTFKGGDTYSYEAVPIKLFEEFISASRASVGSAFHRLIRQGQFEANKEQDYEQPPLKDAIIMRRSSIPAANNPPSA